MHRIDTTNKAVDLFGAGKHGWRDGNKALGINATEFNAAMMNMIQEELCALPEGIGMTLDPNNRTQIRETIKRMIDAQAGNYALDTGAADAYVVALDPAITAYEGGMTVRVKAVNANTGASTLNAGGGAVALVNDAGGALAAGDIAAGSIFTATYIASANKFYITSMVQSQGDARYAKLSGSSVSFAHGSVATPSIYFGAETGTGFYRIGANQTGYAVNGTKVLDISAAAFGFTGRITHIHSEANGATKLKWDDSKHAMMIQNGDFTASSVTKLVINVAAGSYNNGGIIYAEGAGGYNQGQLVFAVGWDVNSLAVERLRISPSSISVTATTHPSAHNTYDLGTTALRWKDLWLQSGAFNGSDARLKTPVAPLTVNEINAAKQLGKEIGTYQWLESIQKKGAAAARHHVGLTVQRAIEIMQANGLDPFAYGFIGYDQWGDGFIEHPAIEAVAAKPAVPAEYIEQVVEELVVVDGVEVTIQRKILVEVKAAAPAVAAVEAQAAWTEQKQAAGDAYSFRYDQLNMFIAAGLEARIAALESALNI